MSALSRKGGKQQASQSFHPTNATVTSGTSAAQPRFLRWEAALVAFVALAATVNIVGNGFAFDDENTVQLNDLVRYGGLLTDYFTHDFWGTPMANGTSHKSLRPLTTLSYRITVVFFGMSPTAFHIGDIILHVFASLSLLSVLAHLFPHPHIAVSAAMLFASHPVHSEAIANVSGRAEILLAVFFFQALKSYLTAMEKSSLSAAITASAYYLGAMLSKEQGFTLIGLTIAFEGLSLLSRGELTAPKSQRLQVSQGIWTALRRTMVMTFPLVLALGLRVSVSGHQLFPNVPYMDNPAAAANSWLTRTLSKLYLLWVNAWLLVFPVTLKADYSMPSVPLLASLDSPQALVALGFLLAMMVLGVWTVHRTLVKNDRSSIIGLLLLILPFVPASNLITAVGFVVAERTLYLPSAGFCLLVALLLHSICNRLEREKLQLAVVIVVVAWYTSRSISRNADWRSEATLWTSELQNSEIPSYRVLQRYASHVLLHNLTTTSARDDYDRNRNIEEPAVSEDAIHLAVDMLHRSLRAMITSSEAFDWLITVAVWCANHGKPEIALETIETTITLVNEEWPKRDISWLMPKYQALFSSEQYPGLYRLHHTQALVLEAISQWEAAANAFEHASWLAPSPQEMSDNIYMMCRMHDTNSNLEAAILPLKKCMHSQTRPIEVKEKCAEYLRMVEDAGG